VINALIVIGKAFGGFEFDVPLPLIDASSNHRVALSIFQAELRIILIIEILSDVIHNIHSVSS
jgi:hypothetical protein